ncbi:hypothetical protein ZOD2009_04247 [Haladaptatus paucihalophilus DX253]|uniref:Metal-binding protein n=1 Tax=Haladaptatus paucihalophilus DX253 TaxID=797209 RepID=E7QPX9_HALPU|nr:MULTISPECIES: UPF0058 family protein [Haladaptatus]EFW93043.1 hypothetical protein ZOD2009_04247 [Haladaptatus paucihalophilus DX253]ODR79344.1 metal-binding protein [Haladaptatus sp. W1]GKZ12442.1 hypothetical protein HAL_03230 [Haladaptatus sp. T7]SHL70038.1 hypothetical protein SAMN05444342_4442 [Haladaptatus paucihalophilus DX253]
MKKQELIHLHGLLAEVGNHFEEQDGKQITLDDYDSLGVRPTSIHKSKTDHKAAVFALSEAITDGMRATEREAVAPQAD